MHKHQHKDQETITPANQTSLPRAVEFALDALTPKEIKEQFTFIDDFRELYDTRIVPRYGKWALCWAWMQVVRTGVVVIFDAVLKFRGKRRA